MPKGRKVIKPTRAMIAKARAMAESQCNDVSIYKALGISHDTYYKWVNNQSEITEEIAKAREKGKAIVHNALFEAARSGNVSAMQFFLSRKCGWHEKIQQDHTSSDGSMTPHITFNGVSNKDAAD